MRKGSHYFLLFFILWSGVALYCQNALKAMGYEDATIKKHFVSLENEKYVDGSEIVVGNKQKAYTIKVCNQKRFENLNQLIADALQSGEENIVVKIKKGTYYFRDGHINWVGKNYPNADITIQSKGATVVPTGWSLKEGEEIPCELTGESSFVDLRTKHSLSTWGEMKYADSLVEVVDLAAKHCRLKCAALGNLNIPEGNMAYLELTRWCRCYQYKVIKIEKGYVDFYAHDLAKDNVFNKPGYNVNYDYIFAKSNPRFRLCNVGSEGDINVINRRVHISKGANDVHLGNASSFMAIYNSSLHSLSVTGITFLGGKPSPQPLIYFRGVKASNIEFRNCTFIGQRGKIMSLYSTDNLLFHSNTVYDNYDWGIEIDNLSSRAQIVDNRFENNGTSLSYNRCVTCSGDNYYIANNSFKNFGYCAISLGVWYGGEMANPSGGVVEYNHIWYDDEHFNNAWKYTIMDAGAIYVWTQNSDAVIRYNYIHDYTGMAQNRGIFCDDGAHHVSIYGNVVVNVPKCHAIDSRRVAGTETGNNANSKSLHNNINNVIMYNLTDGTINFVGNEMAHNGCMKGKNLILHEKGAVRKSHEYKPQLKNLELDVKDEEVTIVGYDEKGIIVSKEAWDEMQKLPCFDGVKRYVRVK